MILQSEQLFITFIVFVLGLLFGSFATMASYRIPRGEDLVVKPSHCTSCAHRLGFLDLFPLFSWLFNRGKCRHCGAGVHWLYPATELVMGVLFAVVYINAGLTLLGLGLMVVSVMSVIATVIYLERK